MTALVVVTLAVHGPAPGWSQQATPTTDLVISIKEQNGILPITGATACVSPHLSEPAFWGKWTARTSGLPAIPGVIWMRQIPVPPGMENENIVITIAKQGYHDLVITDPLSSFVPTAGSTPGSINVRIVRLERGGQSSGDCGTPPADPLRPGLQIFVDPREASARSGDMVTFKLHWSGHDYAAPWYLYEWEIGDTRVAQPVAPSQTPEFQIRAVGPGITLVTPWLLRPDGTRKQGDSARIKVESGAPPPPPPPEQYTFGWERPIDQRAANDFSLPHACAVGMNLQQIVHARPTTTPPGCSIRAISTETCSSCHRMGGASPTLEGIQKDAFCDQVPIFDANPSAATNPATMKPQNLKDFFNDWYNRRDPATNECPD